MFVEGPAEPEGARPGTLVVGAIVGVPRPSTVLRAWLLVAATLLLVVMFKLVARVQIKDLLWKTCVLKLSSTASAPGTSRTPK